MRRRLVVGAIMLGALLVAGCSQQLVGAGSAGSAAAGASRTIGSPSAGPVARTADPAPTDGRTTTVSPTATSSEPAGSSSRSTVTSAETTTQYTTIYEDQPAGPGPGATFGSIDLGPDSSGVVAFQSPSGNIMCGIYDDPDYGGARCDIAEWTFTPPPPMDCGDINYNAGTAEIGSDGAGRIGACAGDTVADPAHPVLQYGQNAGVGPYACHSAEDGVTCANANTGHGFQLSRASYRLF